MRGLFQVPSYISFDCLRILKKLMTVSPIDRGMLQILMKDRWLNLSQKEELRPLH